MKTLVVAILGFLCVTALAADGPPRRYSVTDIEAAIRTGKVGAEYAERAKKMEQLYVREIRGEKIPYQLFTFDDYRGGYTLLVEADDAFVILCTGYADNFTLAKEGDKVTLHYRYITGSGVPLEHTAAYVIGSGTANDVAPPFPRMPPTPQELFDFATSVVLVKRVVQDNQVHSYVKEVWRFDPDAATPPEVGSEYGEPRPYVSDMQYPELDWIVFILGKNRPKGVIGSLQIPVTESGMVGPFRMNVEDLRTALKKTKPKT
jgi:hypothetical protein